MRVGECNGCLGAANCCQFLIMQVNPAYLEGDRRTFIEMHGIRLFEQDGGAWARITAKCTHLTDEGKCGVFGQPERPQACADFPFVQHDIDLVDDWIGKKTCSYSFEVNSAPEGVPEEVH